MSIPDAMAIFLIPIIGYMIDLYGFKVAYLIGSGFALGLGHFLLAGDISSPVIPLIINGFASSSVVAIWPCIPYLVPELYWATAYGIVTVCINASYIFVPICVAILENMDRFYVSVELFFALQSILGAFLAILFDSARKLPPPSATQSTQTLEKMPRAPTFSGPPESFLVSLDDGANNDGTDDESEGEEWGGYDESACSFVSAHSASGVMASKMPSSTPALFHRHQLLSDEPSSFRAPQPLRRIHHIIRFRDDSQIEERVCLNGISRKRGNSVLGT